MNINLDKEEVKAAIIKDMRVKAKLLKSDPAEVESAIKDINYLFNKYPIDIDIIITMTAIICYEKSKAILQQ